MSTANRIIKNTGFLYVKMGVTMFISLYTTRLILNSLGASDFGIFNIVGGAIAMLGFLNGAMASATQRFMSFAEGAGNKEKEKEIFNVSIILHTSLAFIVGLVLLFAGFLFFNGILNIPLNRIGAAEVIYGSLIISTMFTVMTVPYDAAMNAHENMKYYAIIGIFESLLKLVVAFVVVYTLNDKLIVYGILMACIPLISLTIMRIYCHKNYEECVISPRKYWNKALMKDMTSFAGWNFFSSASGMVTQYGLGIVLNVFWGTLLNAALGVANQLAGMVMTFSNNLGKALNPIIVKSEGAGNSEYMIRTTLVGGKYLYLLVAIFAIPFMFAMPIVLKIWLKNVPQWAVIFCVLQILRFLLENLSANLGSSISAKGEIRMYSIVKSGLNFLPLFFTAIAFKFGLAPYWLFISWIFCWSICGTIITLFYAKRLCGLHLSDYFILFLKPVLIISLCVIIIDAILVSVLVQGFLSLLITFVCSTIILFVMTWLTMSKEEKNMSSSLVKSICYKFVLVRFK